MPWCPVCKNEYREGYLRCAECNVDLVDELMEETTEELNEDRAEQFMEETAEEKKKQETVSVYVDPKYRAEEYKTSAYTLLFVGTLGLVILAGIDFGIFPFFQVGVTTKTMMNVVLGILFVVFLGFGVYSLMAYKKILEKGDEEERKIKEVEAYLEKKLSKESMEASLTGKEENDDNSQVLYFERTEMIEAEIVNAFPELEDSLVAKLTEDYYCKLYE